MNSKIVYRSPYNGAYIELSKFAVSEGSEEYGFYSRPMINVCIKTKTDGYLTNFQETRGDEAIAQQRKLIQKAERWLFEFESLAKRKFPLLCNKIADQYCPCPRLRVGDDGKAKCALSPFYKGYSGTWRDVPETLKCDVFEKLGGGRSGKMINFIPSGSSLTLYEHWVCSTGEAQLIIDGEGDLSSCFI